MDATTVLYALSTMAQTCAALAALVGALGLFRLQSIRTRQQVVLGEIRQLLIGIEGSVEWALSTPTDQVLVSARGMVNSPQSEKDRARAPRMTEHLTEWGRFDP